MSRVRPFVLQVDVSEELLRADRRAVALAHEVLRDQATRLVGPRGGRYEAVNQPHDFRDGVTADGYVRNVRTFQARVTGRYVRPTR